MLVRRWIRAGGRSRSTSTPSPARSMSWAPYPATSDQRLDPVRAPDHVEHDLVGARPDPVQAHIAPHALDSVFLHVAGAAVDLNALVGHLDRHARGVQLGHRD